MSPMDDVRIEATAIGFVGATLGMLLAPYAAACITGMLFAVLIYFLYRLKPNGTSGPLGAAIMHMGIFIGFTTGIWLAELAKWLYRLAK